MLPLFDIELDGLITKFMGKTAAKLRLIFEAMEQATGICLFVEFDAIGIEHAMANDVGEVCRPPHLCSPATRSGPLKQLDRCGNKPWVSFWIEFSSAPLMIRSKSASPLRILPVEFNNIVIHRRIC